MISVDEAKDKIKQQVIPLRPVSIPLLQGAGLVLAHDTFSPLDIPAFKQSSMDGYSISYDGWQKHSSLEIAGEIPAGADDPVEYAPHQAVRIFTGAAIPAGTDTVVMQEKVVVTNGILTIEDDNLTQGRNVRPQGSEIKSGEMALPAGSVLSPAAIGFLAGIGLTHAEVYPKPAVHIIVTGKELQQPGNPLQRGQVYESNSSTLRAALYRLHINDVKVSWADDDLGILTQILKEALLESDVVLLTGGISVGDYDFVLEAASQCGIQKIFHRIRQRPGKPLYFGKKHNQLVFGLPGNPSSVLTCFYEYVIPALQLLSRQNRGLHTAHVPLAKKFEKPAGLTHFLKGYFDGEKVSIMEAQESYRLSSFAKANCLVRINENTTQCEANERVEIHLII